MKKLYLIAALSVGCILSLYGQEKFSSLTFKTNLTSRNFNANAEINFHRSERFSWGWHLGGRIQDQQEFRPNNGGSSRVNNITNIDIDTGPSITFYQFLTKNRRWLLSWNFSGSLTHTRFFREFSTFNGNISTQRNNQIGPVALYVRPVLHFRFNEHWSMLGILGEAHFRQDIFQRKKNRTTTTSFGAVFTPANLIIGLRYRLKR